MKMKTGYAAKPLMQLTNVILFDKSLSLHNVTKISITLETIEKSLNNRKKLP